MSDKNYGEMSDLEVNKAVAVNIAFSSENHREGFAVDYCNSWAAAGPIIEEKEISIVFDSDFFAEPPCQWCKTSTPCGEEYYGDRDKPLRAAMIVFLMMQDEKSP